MSVLQQGPGSVREMRRITWVGVLVNVLLSASKIIGGKMCGSVALVADGVHSLSDLVTDVITLVGVSLGARPPDEQHPYGHGRFETISSILIALALVAVGLLLAFEAARSLLEGEHTYPGATMVVLAVISIVAKEILYWMTIRVARRTGSPTLVANAWHHRSDALSSVAVLAGGVVGLAGFPHGDAVAGIVVGLMVVLAGAKIGHEGLCELLEQSVDEAITVKIRAALDGHPNVRSWHKLRTRRVGREIFADVHVLVDPDMTVVQAHDITVRLELDMRQSVSDPINVSIHIEPFEDDHHSLV